MGLNSSKRVVLNWFKYDVSFSLELIETFVRGVEKQATTSFDAYKRYKETRIEEIAPEEGIAHVVELHEGLDSDTWHLEAIFGEYFPNLHRRSALLTICGYFEHELDKLCILYQSEKTFKLSRLRRGLYLSLRIPVYLLRLFCPERQKLSTNTNSYTIKLALRDLTGKGIDRAVNYLHKVAGIETHKESEEWSHLKSIQKIRNIIVHQDGKLLDQQGSPIKPAIDYVKQMDSLNGDDEVMLKDGFLEHVVNVFKEYFRLIDESIRNAEGA